MKKSGEEMLSTGMDDLIAVNNANNAVETSMPVETSVMLVPQPRLHEKVNTMIHERLTDMWLLTTGEDVKNDPLHSKKFDGKPFAIVCDGQMRLMESRPTTLDVLRTVGIEMS
jgi:hypothetical protein